MQELVLFKLSPLHWKVACLSINAGEINNNTLKATDYGAVATAIGKMAKGFVLPPDINNSQLGFKANVKNNNCLFGLGAINGISMELAEVIIECRPFYSFKDFLTKAYDTKLVQTAKVVMLIKAGCFREFNPDAVEIMQEFIDYIVEDKNKLNLSNLPKIMEYAKKYPLLDKDYVKEIDLYYLKKEIFAQANCVAMYNKTQGLYKVPSNLTEGFEQYLLDFKNAVEYDSNGELCLKSKEFTKAYKALIEPLELLIKSDVMLKKYNYIQKIEAWNKHCSGTIETWEMDSIGYYTDRHEFENFDISNRVTIENFFDLSLEPEKEQRISKATGNVYYRNKLHVIAGVVVDRNKTKHLVTLNTQYGIVNIKLSKEIFTNYDRRTAVEKSWFSRGSKLVIVGYRRNENFYAKVYNDTIFHNSIIKIEFDLENNVVLRDIRFTEEKGE